MDEQLIYFAMWLNENTTMFAGAYEFKGKLFYADSGKDMENLLTIYKLSDYYKNLPTK